jgi:hypothetical protein
MAFGGNISMKKHLRFLAFFTNLIILSGPIQTMAHLTRPYGTSFVQIQLSSQSEKDLSAKNLKVGQNIDLELHFTIPKNAGNDFPQSLDLVLLPLNLDIKSAEQMTLVDAKEIAHLGAKVIRLNLLQMQWFPGETKTLKITAQTLGRPYSAVGLEAQWHYFHSDNQGQKVGWERLYQTFYIGIDEANRLEVTPQHSKTLENLIEKQRKVLAEGKDQTFIQEQLGIRQEGSLTKAEIEQITKGVKAGEFNTTTPKELEAIDIKTLDAANL